MSWACVSPAKRRINNKTEEVVTLNEFLILFIDDIEIGGAATWMENAGDAAVNLFI